MPYSTLLSSITGIITTTLQYYVEIASIAERLQRATYSGCNPVRCTEIAFEHVTHMI
jgi:hypothetical protein